MSEREREREYIDCVYSIVSSQKADLTMKDNASSAVFPCKCVSFFFLCVCVCAQRTWRIPQCQLYLFVVDFDVDNGRAIKCVDPRDITSTKGSVTYNDKLLANDTHVSVGWCGIDRERVLAVLGKR